MVVNLKKIIKRRLDHVFNKSYTTGCNVPKITLNWLRIEETDIGILRPRFTAHCAPFSKHEIKFVMTYQLLLKSSYSQIQSIFNYGCAVWYNRQARTQLDTLQTIWAKMLSMFNIRYLSLQWTERRGGADAHRTRMRERVVSVDYKTRAVCPWLLA